MFGRYFKTILIVFFGLVATFESQANTITPKDCFTIFADFSNSIYLQLDNSESRSGSEIVVTIANVNGRDIEELILDRYTIESGNGSIDLGNYPTGVYIISVYIDGVKLCDGQQIYLGN